MHSGHTRSYCQSDILGRKCHKLHLGTIFEEFEVQGISSLPSVTFFALSCLDVVEKFNGPWASTPKQLLH